MNKTKVAQSILGHNQQGVMDNKSQHDLTREIEKREFDLGLAPDDAYLKGDKSILQGMEEAFNEVFGVTTLP